MFDCGDEPTGWARGSTHGNSAEKLQPEVDRCQTQIISGRPCTCEVYGLRPVFR